MVRGVIDQIAPSIPSTASPPSSRRRKGPKGTYLSHVTTNNHKIVVGLASFRSNPNLLKLNQSMSSSGAPPSPIGIKKTASMDFSRLDQSQDDDALSGAPVEDLPSSFYEWSCEYFSKPMMSFRGLCTQKYIRLNVENRHRGRRTSMA